MASAARSCLATGVAAISVGVVAGPVTALPSAAKRLSTESYRLAAESSLLNVPVNLFNMALSMPAWEIQAMNRLADAMNATGSWQVWGPTNVIGFDEQDPPKLKAVIEMLMPVEPFSSVVGSDLSWWATANLPMNAGCAANPGACPDVAALWKGWYKVSDRILRDGYQFPTVTNPFTLQETSWSGQTVKLDDAGAFRALWDYLTGPSAGVATVPLGDYFITPAKSAKSLFDAYYPFVQNSEWFNKDQTILAPVFAALAPVTCPSCAPGNPYDNPWLYDNYPPAPAAGAAVPVPAASTPAPEVPVADLAAEPADPATEPGDSAEVSPEEGAQSPTTVAPVRRRDVKEVSTARTVNDHTRSAKRAGRS